MHEVFTPCYQETCQRWEGGRLLANQTKLLQVSEETNWQRDERFTSLQGKKYKHLDWGGYVCVIVEVFNYNLNVVTFGGT